MRSPSARHAGPDDPQDARARGGERHGFEIAAVIGELSGDVFFVEEGSLYPRRCSACSSRAGSRCSGARPPGTGARGHHRLTPRAGSACTPARALRSRLARADACAGGDVNADPGCRPLAPARAPPRGGSARRSRRRDRLHLDLIGRQLRERGLSPDAARAEAPPPVRQPVVAAKTRAPRLRWLDDLRQDAGYAVRALIKDRRFAASALVTLALGIGATTAIFSASAASSSARCRSRTDRLVQIFGRSA